MFKALLVIALALSLCQAKPTKRDCGKNDLACLNELANLPIERSWMETSNKTIVPLLSIKREIVRTMMHLNESAPSLDEWSTNEFAKRIVESMTEEQKKRFLEPFDEFVEKRNQFTREFADLQENNLDVKGFGWTDQVKRVWKETSSGSVVPMKRDEWLQFLNNSVVAPVRRIQEGNESLIEDIQEKREFLTSDNQLDEQSKRQGLFSREFNEFSKNAALNFLRQTRSLSLDQIQSQNDTQFAKMCDGSQGFKYYQAHPTNETLYIQCDPWGQPIVRECETGLVWNQWRLNCTTVEELKNASSSVIDGAEFDLLSVVQALFDCTQPQFACMNGGVCNKLSTGFKCVCSVEYTGDVCEVKVDSSSIYSEILSGQFPFQSYKKSLVSERRQEDDLKYFEQFKESLSKSTYDELVKYLSSYKTDEVRYDRLVSSLVEDILQDIYPDAFYLSVFNASQETVGNVVRMIPNLLSYGKYSTERYVQVFYQYQKTLDQLVGLLNSSWSTVTKEANDYYALTTKYLNNTVLLNRTYGYDERVSGSNGSVSFQGAPDTVTVNVQPSEGAFSFGSKSAVSTRRNSLGGGLGPVQWTESDVMGKLKSEYNETLQNTTNFYDFLERFRLRALVEIK